MSHPYFFISENNVSENLIEVTGDDLVHLSRVLRARKGEIVELSDNTKYRYVTEITLIKKDKAELKILNKTVISKNPVKPFCISVCLRKIPWNW